MLELVVQTDIGEPGKKVSLDTCLRGSSSDSSNFNTLFREYTLQGRKILGTKAVVVNIDGFLDYIAHTYVLPADARATIKDTLMKAEEFKETEKYWSAFWDKTSEVHHRDIMRYCYEAIRQAVDTTRREMNRSDAYNSCDDIAAAVETMNSLEEISEDMATGLYQLYEAKVGATSLSPIAVTMLQYAQGYQLSSERADKANQLWRSRVKRVQLSSGITADQRKYVGRISPDETVGNVQHLLSALEATDIVTGRLEIPEDYNLPVKRIPVRSTATFRKGNGTYVRSRRSQFIRICYTAAK